jgi:hypothetical protein
MRIQIHLIESCLQLTKFQLFQRIILDFNRTAMIISIDIISSMLYKFKYFIKKSKSNTILMV